MCIFGSGCQGIYADRPDDGCCTLGCALRRQGRLAAGAARGQELGGRRSGSSGRRTAAGHKDSWTEMEDGDRKTRVVDGACIFLNRPGFAGRGRLCPAPAGGPRRTPPLETKPDVCWQLPIRRSYRTVERPDGTEYLEVTSPSTTGAGGGPAGTTWTGTAPATPRRTSGASRCTGPTGPSSSRSWARRRTPSWCCTAPHTFGPCAPYGARTARRCCPCWCIRRPWPLSNRRPQHRPRRVVSAPPPRRVVSRCCYRPRMAASTDLSPRRETARHLSPRRETARPRRRGSAAQPEHLGRPGYLRAREPGHRPSRPHRTPDPRPRRLGRPRRGRHRLRHRLSPAAFRRGGPFGGRDRAARSPSGGFPAS